MLQSFISFRETVQDMIEVAPEEILTWENDTVSLSMITESRICSFIAEASWLAKAMLACLLFHYFVLRP